MLALLEPLEESILVRPIPEPKMTASGLIKPDTGKDIIGRGIVEKVGPGEQLPDGLTRRPMPVQPGDLVFFGGYNGQWVRLFGMDRLSIRASEILFRIPGEHIVTVSHPEEGTETEHLAGEPCQFCAKDAAPPAALEPTVDLEDVAARARLAELRDNLRIVGGKE